MSKKKHVLYIWFEGLNGYGYFPAQAVKCDFCEKVFKVDKGFVLINDFIICYKHLKDEFLKRVDDVRKKSNIT